MLSPLSPLAGLLQGGLPAALGPSGSWQWIAVEPRFAAFAENVLLTQAQFNDGLTKFGGVVRSLNAHYYGTPSATDNAFLVGSWGKGTMTRPPRDVDLYFVLPPHVHARFEQYMWNPQSALLQEVKDVLLETFPATDLRGDGQVVCVNFASCGVEVVPAFRLTSGRYWICDTHDGGSYKVTDPHAETANLEKCDAGNNRNLRPMIRMLKSWQEQCSVPIKSFVLELATAAFLSQSPWRQNSYFYYDWLFRDFFAYLRGRAGGFTVMPGTYEVIDFGREWLSRAETAYDRALKACDYERDNNVHLAGEEWQKIFGTKIPVAP